ncbi:hypothetical protein W822_09390 [Advenella kashmirensis W13003]|uniref:AAA+ ATPase domain-containing protein n=1 Tax=Advenella kashmirensis W13003 TaxID=1424334 RepID=V8QV24_9BURK|nr:AAA family ATPase [Advenella kashmirensis]ETF03492.1 hypothetical protein W822_09390 [Advenella kashmirensis W13003]
MKKTNITDTPEDDVVPDTITCDFNGAFEPPEALDSFFDDDFFMLVYALDDDATPSRLWYLKEQLKLVLDKSTENAMRAQVAKELADHVAARSHNARALTPDDLIRAKEWYELALGLGNVQAAQALASLYLADRLIGMHMDPEPMGLLVFTDILTGEPVANKVVDRHAYDAWYRGVCLTLCHAELGFVDWDAHTFEAAFTCILGFLSIEIPRDWTPTVGRRFPNRTRALSWLGPLWKALVQALTKAQVDPLGNQADRIEQFLAVQLALKAEEISQGDRTTKRTPRAEVASASTLQVQVIKGEIPPSSDRSDASILKSYEELRKPIALAAIPTEAALQEIKCVLQRETPWAELAITTILSDMFARSRHGVLALGIAPTLLVGPPGSGKTRFCQRLSELLGIPNTVINMAGMGDAKLFKGITRGWASNRPSRIVEFIAQNRLANPFFILDEVDKAGETSSNGGHAQQALLDLLEPVNARRYQDVFLMAECDVSHCLYLGTANSLASISAPLRSRFRLVYFPAPRSEHAEAIVSGVLADIERSWSLPVGALTLPPEQRRSLVGIAPRQMRHAVLDILGAAEHQALFTRH